MDRRALVLGLLCLECGGCCSAPMASPPGQAASINVVGARIATTHVAFKFRDGAHIRLRNAALVVLERSDRDLADLAAAGLTPAQVDADLVHVKRILAAHRVVDVEPLYTSSEDDLTALRSRAEGSSGPHLPDLTLYFRVRLRAEADATATDELMKLASVEVAYRQRRALSDRKALRQAGAQVLALAPGVAAPCVPGAPAPPTDFEGRQGYLDGPPGIWARCAWCYPGGTGCYGAGQSIQIVDVEMGWNQHEDLPPLDPSCMGHPGDHGTNVLGVLEAKHDGNGVTGIAFGATVRCQPISLAKNNVEDAVLQAVHTSDVNIVLIEYAPPGPDYVDAPAECLPGVHDAIKYATATGVIVVEAAGETIVSQPADLGSKAYKSCFGAGAIVVSSVASSNYDTPSLYSNYGTPITLCGWGDQVLTTGIGNLEDASKNCYNTNFDGTSAAAAMIAGAVADLEGIARSLRLNLAPAEIAATMQASGTKINEVGALPDLSKAAVALYKKAGKPLPSIPAGCVCPPSP